MNLEMLKMYLKALQGDFKHGLKTEESFCFDAGKEILRFICPAKPLVFDKEKLDELITELTKS